MAEIFSVTLPDGSQYDLKDQVSRDFINEVAFKEDITYGPSDIINFNSDISKPVKNLKINIKPIQDLHGYEYPWPAGGGKNLLPYPYPNFSGESQVVNDVTITNLGDGRIKLNGTANAGAAVILMGKSQWQSKWDQPAGSYIFSCGFTNAPSDMTINFQMTDGANNNEASVTAGNNNQTLIFSTGMSMTGNNNARNIYVVLSSGVQYQNTILAPMIRRATETSDTFAPYSNICPISGWTGCNISHSGVDTSDPTVIHISWQSSAGTVYGGTLKLPSCVLTVNRAIVDLGTLTWTYQSQYTRFVSSDISDAKLGPARTMPAISSKYIVISDGRPLSEVPDKSGYLSPNGNEFSFYVHDTSYTDAAAFKAAMSGVQLVYELATSQTYQLTPTEVTTLLGQNNIWADCGKITLTNGSVLSSIQSQLNAFSNYLSSLQS